MAKCSEILRLLMKNGWSIERQKGSHIILVHTTRTNKIVFPNHGSAEIKTGTLQHILKAAGLDKGNKRKK